MTERQTQIVEIATELIAENGIQHVTIKNIAAALSVSEPAIYRHFASKKAILQEVLNQFEILAEQDLLVSNAGHGLEAIEQFLASRYRLFSAKPHLAKVMFSEDSFRYDADLSAQMLKIMHSHRAKVEYFLTVTDNLGETAKQLPTTALFRIIFGSMRLLVTQWNLTGQGFDLQAEGKNLWLAIKKLLQR